MSDFLDMVAAEPTGARPVLEPLMPSRFERPTWSQSANCDFAAQGFESADDIGVAPSAPATSVVAPLVHETSRTSDGEPDRGTGTAWDAGERHESAALPWTQRDERMVSEDAAGVREDQRETKLAVFQSDLLQQIGEVARELRALQRRESAPPVVLHRPHSEQRAPSDARAVGDETVSLTTTRIEAKPAPEVAPMHIVPERLPALERRSHEAPTVNVTIGRIEIRGREKPEAAAPARDTSRARVMSLAQYLERRSAGGGR